MPNTISQQLEQYAYTLASSYTQDTDARTYVLSAQAAASWAERSKQAGGSDAEQSGDEDFYSIAYLVPNGGHEVRARRNADGTYTLTFTGPPPEEDAEQGRSSASSPSTSRPAPASWPTAPSTQPASKGNTGLMIGLVLGVVAFTGMLGAIGAGVYLFTRKPRRRKRR